MQSYCGKYSSFYAAEISADVQTQSIAMRIHIKAFHKEFFEELLRIQREKRCQKNQGQSLDEDGVLDAALANVEVIDFIKYLLFVDYLYLLKE